MAGNETLRSVDARGWRAGFANMFRKESGDWWRTKSWLVRSAVWLLVVNGMIALVLSGAGRQPQLRGGLAAVGIQLFVTFLGMFAPIGVAIIGLDAIIPDKQLGTAAWILSKPVSRSAFVLSKLAADGLGALITVAGLPTATAYVQISLAARHPLSPAFYLAGFAMLLINLAFYLTLTVMLGTLFRSRSAVIGIPLAFLFSSQLWLGRAPWLQYVTPWRIFEMAGAVIAGKGLPYMTLFGVEIPAILPVVATLVWIGLFVAIALWRFGREEF